MCLQHKISIYHLTTVSVSYITIVFPVILKLCQNGHDTQCTPITWAVCMGDNSCTHMTILYGKQLLHVSNLENVHP